MDDFCECTFPEEDPIVIGFGPLLFTDPEHGVPFDYNCDGVAEHPAWTDATSQVAFLVLDRNGNGTIDNGSEFFGRAVMTVAGTRPSSSDNGFTRLAALDDPAQGGNGDGIIDNRDAMFRHLQMWFDRNHDGVSQPDELVSLSDAGVVSIELTYVAVGKRDTYGNYMRYRSRVHFSDGTHGTAWDVFLKALNESITQVPSNASVKR